MANAASTIGLVASIVVRPAIMLRVVQRDLRDYVTGIVVVQLHYWIAPKLCLASVSLHWLLSSFYVLIVLVIKYDKQSHTI